MNGLLARVVAVALLTPLLLFGQAQPQKAAPSKNSSVEQQLIKLEEAWSDAFIKGDLAFLDRFIADDITCTDENGTVWGKTQWIGDLKSGDLKFTSIANDDYKVRVYGKAAVVTYRFTAKWQYKGKDVSGQYRETDTLVKSAGRWQCVAVHYSKIVEEK
jgi:ketosteroid isomerase-like protein